MIHDLVAATYISDYKIELTFDDGKRGIVDFIKYTKRGGVFKHWKDLNLFCDFRVDKELGTIVWRENIDIAPETLYAEATGTPLPEWMANETAPEAVRG
jgi:hypothetical protein